MNKRERSSYLLGLAGLLAFLVFSIRTHRQELFEKTATGLEYRIVSKGKGPSPQEGEMLLLDVSYKTSEGEVLLSSKDQELPLAIRYSKDMAPADGNFVEAIKMLQKGDSLIFRFSAAKILDKNLAYIANQHDLKRDTKIFLHLQLKDIMTEEAHKKWETEQIAMLPKRRQEEAEQQLQEDAKAIANYLVDHQITAKTTSSGLCYEIETPGRGVQPKQGDKVKVNYTGWLLDGKIFDTSLEDVAKQHGIHTPKRIYEPLEFQLGAGEIIQGWEEGIRLLHQGGKARLFIPSTLAYGSQSVGNGLVPPNAVLVFEVELVDVQK